MEIRAKQRNWKWWLWFAVGILLMVSLNLYRLYSTWEDYYLDGCRSIGWPFGFLWDCALSGRRLSALPLLTDTVIALVFAKLFADIRRDGLRSWIHWARTAGTPLAD